MCSPCPNWNRTPKKAFHFTKFQVPPPANPHSRNGRAGSHVAPEDHKVVWGGCADAEYIPPSMQVPPDLASQLSSAALMSGRSPEAFLREAISRLIDSTMPKLAAFEETPPKHAGFVPQPQSFSVYE